MRRLFFRYEVIQGIALSEIYCVKVFATRDNERLFLIANAIVR